MNGFGASALIDDLYNHFNITAKAVVASAKDQLGGDQTATVASAKARNMAYL